jgi:hypothetical protein
VDINLARYGHYSERTYARQFERSFPWLEYHAKTIQSALPSAHELIAAQDASFIPKSGKKTYGLDKFYNGCASRPERGIEISALAVVDVTQKGAYIVTARANAADAGIEKRAGRCDAARPGHRTNEESASAFADGRQ